MNFRYTNNNRVPNAIFVVFKFGVNFALTFISRYNLIRRRVAVSVNTPNVQVYHFHGIDEIKYFTAFDDHTFNHTRLYNPKGETVTTYF